MRDSQALLHMFSVKGLNSKQVCTEAPPSLDALCAAPSTFTHEFTRLHGTFTHELYACACGYSRLQGTCWLVLVVMCSVRSPHQPHTERAWAHSVGAAREWWCLEGEKAEGDGKLVD